VVSPLMTVFSTQLLVFSRFRFFFLFSCPQVEVADANADGRPCFLSGPEKGKSTIASIPSARYQPPGYLPTLSQSPFVPNPINFFEYIRLGPKKESVPSRLVILL